MTVQELLNVMSFCDLLEVVVRKTGHGQWIQGYRVGKEVKIYPTEYTVEEIEKRSFRSYERRIIDLEKGEEVDIKHGFRLPMKVICKDCHKLPEYIGRLEVCEVLPRKVPEFHGESLTHNNFSLYVDCYPDNYTPEKYISSTDVTKKAIEDNQLSIFNYLEVKTK